MNAYYIIFATVLYICFINSTSKEQRVLQNTPHNYHLARSMLDKLYDGRHRTKRQYISYPVSQANQYPQLLTFYIDPSLEKQFVNSPQYVLMPSNNPLPPQVPQEMTQIQRYDNRYVNVRKSDPVPTSNEVKRLINLAVRSAISSQSRENNYNETPKLRQLPANMGRNFAVVNVSNLIPLQDFNQIPQVLSTTTTTTIPIFTLTPIYTHLLPAVSQDPTPNHLKSAFNDLGLRSANITTIPYPANNTTVCAPRNVTKNPNEVINVLQEEIEAIQGKQYSGVKEGLPCKLAGTWKSYTAGVIFTINTDTSDFPVELGKSYDTKGFFGNLNWEVIGQVPFQKVNVLVMTAINGEDNRIATFTGECRFCKGKESISGHWLILRPSSTCQEMNKGQKFLGDVWDRRR